MDSGFVAVGRVLVAHARGQMEASADLLVEQGVLHGMKNVGVDAQSEFAEVAGPFVRVQKSVDPFVVVGRGLDDLPVFDLKADVLIGEALLLRRRVIGNDAVHGVLDRSGVDFPVRDVSLPVAFDGPDALYGKAEVGPGSLDPYPVGPVHQVHQGIHGFAHLPVVQGADVEVEVLECFLAASGQLGHGSVGIAKDHPLGLVDPVVQGRLGQLVVHVQLFGGHVGQFGCVGAGPDGDVGLHALHLSQGDLVHEPDLVFAAAQEQFSGDDGISHFRKRLASLFIDVLDQLPRKVSAAFAFIVDQHPVSRLYIAGITDQKL